MPLLRKHARITKKLRGSGTRTVYKPGFGHLKMTSKPNGIKRKKMFYPNSLITSLFPKSNNLEVQVGSGVKPIEKEVIIEKTVHYEKPEEYNPKIKRDNKGVAEKIANLLKKGSGIKKGKGLKNI